ncbi:MAG: hypothetical protein R3B95_15590 [Nitrospirales bacterium]|nr:hypothetical protein [Nitrospirales bacterium]
MAMTVHRIGVITGDPRLTDPTKRNAQYNEEDTATYNAMKAAFQELSDYTFLFYDDHVRLSKPARRTTWRKRVGERAPRWKRGTPCHMRDFG